MFESIITSVEKLITDFSWKKLFTLVLVGVILCVFFLAVDSTTKYFSLSRIDKEIQLLASISTIKTSSDSELEVIRSTLIKKLNENVNDEVAFSTLLGFSVSVPEWFFLGLSTAMPWLLLSVPFIAGTLRKDYSSTSTFLGMIVLTLLFSIIGAFIPVFFGEGFRYFIFPIVLFIVVLIPLAIIGNRMNKTKNAD